MTQASHLPILLPLGASLSRVPICGSFSSPFPREVTPPAPENRAARRKSSSGTIGKTIPGQ